MHIRTYDHAGIRVTDAARALRFYGKLGFILDEKYSSATAAEIVNASGLRLNLILNGVPTPEGDNILLDRPTKWPGYTHAAFTVDKLQEVLDWAAAEGVTITEGPVDWGRRTTCFLRDPDSNVLEFNEIKPDDSEEFTLVIGQKNYSSWSMRAWLALKTLRVQFREITVLVYRPESRDAVRALGGETGLVPVLIDRDITLWDTMAIFEHLYEWDPVIWPMGRRDRARARSLCGEMHSGFTALRNEMPVNTRARGRKVARSPELDADIARITAIWNTAKGDWLLGDFCAVDIMFAPVATRFQTYGVHLDGAAKTYCERLLAHPLVAEWLSLGRAETDEIAVLEVGRHT